MGTGKGHRGSLYQLHSRNSQGSQCPALQRAPAAFASGETNSWLQMSLIWTHGSSHSLMPAAWVPLCSPNASQPLPCLGSDSQLRPLQLCKGRSQQRAPALRDSPSSCALARPQLDTQHSLHCQVCTHGKILEPQKCALIAKAYRALWARFWPHLLSLAWDTGLTCRYPPIPNLHTYPTLAQPPLLASTFSSLYAARSEGL